MPWSISTAYFKVLVLGYYLNRGKYFSDVLEALKQLEVLLTYVHFSGFTEVFALYGISSNANWMVLCL